MKNILTGLSLLTLLFIQACSSGSELTRDTSKATTDSNSNRPSWFYSEGVTADSVGITSVSMTVSGDSLNALQTSEKKARMELEVYVGDMLEELRLSEVIDGEQSLNQKEFIFQLRQAHQQLEQQARLLQHAVVKESGGYMGFASVQLGREEMLDLIRSAMPEHTDELNKLFAAGDYLQLKP